MRTTIGYQVAPGCCFTCRNPESTALVIDLEDDDPGVVKRHRVYLCATCVKAAAVELQKAGADFVVVSRESWEASQFAAGAAAEVEARLLAVTEQVEAVRAAARALVESDPF
jgi:hypothetical protein